MFFPHWYDHLISVIFLTGKECILSNYVSIVLLITLVAAFKTRYSDFTVYYF